MIKCNRCGKVTPAGAFCQACGAPLSTGAEAPGMEAQDQPALPAWLESLRAGERLSAPVSDPPNFSTADFMDDGSLPNWMRAERSGGRDNTASNPSLAGAPLAPSSFEPNASAANAIDLQSLIDEQALPPWMQDMKGSQPAPMEPGALAASSLVQPEDAPDWMKVLQQPSMNASSPLPPTSAPSPSPFDGGQPGFSAPSPSPFDGGQPGFSAPSSSPFDMKDGGQSGFSAGDLLDQQSLPAWMKNLGSSNPGASSADAQMKSSGAWGMPQGQDAMGASKSGQLGQGEQAGFSARDLLDQQSLPTWMKEQGAARPGASSADAQMKSSGVWGMPQGQSATGANKSGQLGQGEQAGFSARDLVDQQSLPTWMKEQGTARPGASSADAQMKSSGVWGTSQGQGGIGVNKSGQLGQGEQAGFSARDLVDQQSLPTWMKEQGTARPGASSADAQMKSSGAWGMSQGQSATGANKSGQLGQGEQAGFSARDLLDQQSLPTWMKEQGTARPGTPSADAQMPSVNKTKRLEDSDPAANVKKDQAGVGGQSGFSASSLLDVDSLPQWLRSGGLSENRVTGAYPATKVPSRPGQAPQPPAQPAWPAASASNPAWGASDPLNAPGQSSQNNGVAASSFIDINALPEWMRTANEQPQSGMPTPSGSSPAIPHRIDGARVPNRPRREMGMNEGSEEAANVFASMLGVASGSSGAPSPSGFQQQNMNAGVQGRMNQPGMGSSQGNMGMPGGMSQPGIGSSQGNMGVPGGMNQPGMGSQGNMGMPGGMNQPGMGMSQGNMGMPGGMNQPGMGSQGNMGMPGGMNQPGMGSQGNMGMPGGMNQPGAYNQGSQLQYGTFGQYDIPGQSGGLMGQPPQSPMSNMPPLDSPYALSGSQNPGYGMPGGAGNQNASGMYGGGSGYGNNGMYGSGNGNMGYGDYKQVPPSPAMGQPAPSSPPPMGSGSAMRSMPDPTGDQKNKKRGLFGAFLDWLSR